jgi:undecaprenyl-diphosphatase
MNLNIWQILVLALLQGVTELFPISSLGHTVIVPGLLPHLFPPDFATNTSCGGQSCFLPLIVALHLGTSIALVAYFWRDWLQVMLAIFQTMKNAEIRKDSEEWVSWLIVIGCIPGALLGVALQGPLTKLFSSAIIAAAFLVVNGAVLFLGETLRRRTERRAASSSTSGQGGQIASRQWADFPTAKTEALGHSPRPWEPFPGDVSVLTVPSSEHSPHLQTKTARSLASLSWKEALLVGLAQSFALLPGISRSGATMVAGLGVGLSHEDAARYSFLLGTPLIGGAALIEVPQLFGLPVATLGLVLIGMGVAGVAAFLSTKFLLKYFETGRLYPFAYYCWGAGLLSLMLFLTMR